MKTLWQTPSFVIGFIVRVKFSERVMDHCSKNIQSANDITNAIQNPQMAGYIYALYAICQNTPSGNVVFGGLLSTLSQTAPAAPPAPPFDPVMNGNAAIALRCFMMLVGSDDFKLTLADEFSQQSKLSSAYQCQAFMVGTSASPGFPAVPGLYALLNKACTFTDYSPPTPAPSPAVPVPTNVLDLCQKYVAAMTKPDLVSSGVYNRMIQTALLDTTCPLAQIIVNIGQATSQTPPYAGYPNVILGSYRSPAKLLDPVGNCLRQFLYLSSRQDTADILSSLTQIQTIGKTKIPGQAPTGIVDPIFQLVLAILGDSSFNATAGYPSSLAGMSAPIVPAPDPDTFAGVLQTDLGILPGNPTWTNPPSNWSVLLTNLQAFVYYG